MLGRRWKWAALVLLVVTGAACPCILFGTTENRDPLVRMTPFWGQFGYRLEGAYGFAGAATKSELTAPDWRLEGGFCFPTTGYQVSAPEMRVQESYPEHVQVIFTVTPPVPGSAVAPVVTRVPVNAAIAASYNALFTIRIN
jgi:hypothetical protein